MEWLLEVILQFFLEFLLQIVAEVFCELGMHPFAQLFGKRPIENPVAAGLAYFLLGAAIGGLSLLVVGASLIHHSSLRILSLFLTPILAGLVMLAVGSLRRKRGQPLVRLDRFGYGFIFAFGMAVVRFAYARRPVS